MYPNSIKNIIDCFKDLPGIGEKTAERLAFSLINFNKEKLTSFSDAIIQVRDKLKYCDVCGNITENDICDVCANEDRNSKIIFVVEKAKDISLFEKMNIFNGKYHVLDGLISNGNYNNINIDKLINRIDNGNVAEVILALEPNIDGEVTSLYISKLLDSKNVSVSKLAHGVPLGADMDYLDLLTLETALTDRKQINSK